MTDKKAAPPTPEQRKSAVENLTQKNGQATALQIKGLKKVLGDILKAKPEKEEMIGKIAIATQNFTDISKTNCEVLIVKIGEELKEAKQYEKY